MHYERQPGELEDVYRKRLLHELHKAGLNESGRAILDVIENEALVAYNELLAVKDSKDAWPALLTLKTMQGLHARITTNVAHDIEALEKKRLDDIASETARNERKAAQEKRLRASGAPSY